MGCGKSAAGDVWNNDTEMRIAVLAAPIPGSPKVFKRCGLSLDFGLLLKRFSLHSFQGTHNLYRVLRWAAVGVSSWLLR